MMRALLPLVAAAALGTAATMPVEIHFNDKQVVAAMKEINDHEIEMGEMADDKASRADVKDFAMMMQREHEALNDQLDDLDDLEGDEDATPLVDELERAHEQSHDMISRLDSASFDAAYMRAMVEGHQRVLDMVDNKFLPVTTSPALRSLLQAARPKIEAHLRQAERIAGATARPAPDAATTRRP